MKVFCQSKYRWLCAQKIYKLKQTKLSQFVYSSLVSREQGDTKTNYSAPKSFRQTMTEAEHNRPIPKLFSNRPSSLAAEVFGLLSGL